MSPKQPVIKVAPSKVSTANNIDDAIIGRLQGRAITISEHALIREYLRYAVESLEAVITLEERCGNRKPIVDALREYRNEGAALLARIG